MGNAIDTIKSFVNTVWDEQGMHIDRVDQFVAEDCVFHDAMPGLEGREGYKNLLRMLETLAPTKSTRSTSLMKALAARSMRGGKVAE